MAKNETYAKTLMGDVRIMSVWCFMALSAFTVTNSLIIIPLDDQQEGAFGYHLPKLEDGSITAERGKRTILYESLVGPQYLPPETDGSDYIVVKRFMRSERRPQEYEGKESRPGLPLRFGKRSIARYAVERIPVKLEKWNI